MQRLIGRFLCLTAVMAVVGAGCTHTTQDVDIRPDAPTDGIQVSADGTALTVSYAGVTVLKVCQFYFADNGWSNLLTASVPRLRGSTGSAVNSEKKDGVAGYELTVSADRHRVDLAFSYDIPADSKVRFAVADLFLEKGLFLGARRSGLQDGEVTGEFNAFGAVEDISFDTRIGQVACHFSVEGEMPSRWVLRDTRGQNWRPSDLQTFSFLNSLKRDPGTVQHQTIRATIEVTPRPYLAYGAEADGLLAALGRLEQGPKAVRDAVAADAGISRLKEDLEALRNLEKTEPGWICDVLAKGQGKVTTLVQAYNTADPGGSISAPVIIPRPQQMRMEKGRFAVGDNTVILVPDTASREGLRGATLLREELHDYFGVTVPIVRSSDMVSGKQPIVLAVADGSPFAETWGRASRLSVSPTEPGPEGYALRVSRKRAVVLGSDLRGAFYGVQSLLQLFRRDTHGAVHLPAVQIRDWPDMAFRAMMIIPSRNVDLDYFKRAIRRVCARHKLNTVVIGEASMGFIRWKSHPEIAVDGAWTPEQLRECVDFAREHFLDVIPLVQCWGHCKHVVKTCPDLAEVPGEGSAVCLSKPEVKTFLTDIYAEAIEIFQPKIFHIGGDEARPMGKCGLCRDVAPDKLVADHITYLHDWLAKRGVKTMMWHDMLVEHGRWEGMSPANSGNPAYGGVITHPAAEVLPKDIIMAVWIYRHYDAYPPLDYFKEMGFPIVGCPWYNKQNNFSLAKATYEAGGMGFLGTSWMFTSWRSLNMMSILSAEYAWTPGKPELDDLPYVPGERLHRAMLPATPLTLACSTEPIPIAASCNRGLQDDVAGDGQGWLDQGPRADLRLLPTGNVRLDSIDFHILAAAENAGKQCVAVAGPDLGYLGLPVEAKGIAVGRKARSLVLLHTSSKVNRARDFAEYVVHFADGSETHVPLSELRNIAPCRKPEVYDRGFKRAMYAGYVSDARRAWVGLDLSGEEIDLQAFEWINPTPEKEITSIDLRVLAKNRQAAVFLVALSAVP